MVTNRLERIDIRTDSVYLSKRFELFEKYTVPSIKMQTNQHFYWVVLFSHALPDKYRQKVEKIQETLPNLLPLFLSDDDEPQIAILNLISKYQFETLITSRIDNDDAVHLDFIDTIQRHISIPTTSELIIFPNGLQYDCTKQLMTHYHFPNNHFSTLVIANSCPIKTILDYDHMKINRFFPTRFLNKEKPMWLEVVHDGNILNRMYLKFETLTFDFEKLELFGQKNIPDHSGKFRSYGYVLLNKPYNTYRLIKNYGIHKLSLKGINRFKEFIKSKKK